ncbi:MAG: hypothetical protein ACRDZ4_22715 [Egibacteraceae bacterium]
MFKRLFFSLVGLGAGIALGGYAVRKVERARAKLSPDQLAAAAGRRAGCMRDRAAQAIAVGRAAAAEREAELRAAYGMDSPPA